MHTSHPQARGWCTTVQVCWRPSPAYFSVGGTAMRPVLWHWRGLRIPSYPAMLYLGLVCGVAASNVAAHAAQLAAGRVFVATLVLLIPALLGARLLFVLTHWDLYRADPGRIWRRAQSGGALYGGVPCALLASVPLLWALQL